MTVFPIHRRRALADRPVHTGPGCCTGCQAVPGAEHGFACPAVDAHHGDNLPVFRGLLIGLPLGAALWAALWAVGNALIGA